MAHSLHHLPGRLRIRIPFFKRNEQALVTARTSLEGVEGVTSVAINPVTGSLTINYDPRVLAPAELSRAMSDRGYLGADGTLTSTVGYYSARNPQIGQTVGQAVLGVVIEKLVQRSAVALIGALI
jgi:Heavy metal associated domain 2